ncbi:MAG: hypothetical protein JWQ35_2404 [Bacteriovoracaceae bacterium]|nr:hypothetical protein [Bacteriovoracaceae bacterium]
MAVSMKGVFEFLNEFEIDWRKLLHATQSFTYHSPIKIPLEAISETKLADVKFRNSIHWLSFETQVKDKATSKPLITSKSLLLVRES